MEMKEQEMRSVQEEVEEDAMIERTALVRDIKTQYPQTNCHNPKAKQSKSNPTQKQPKVTWLWV